MRRVELEKNEDVWLPMPPRLVRVFNQILHRVTPVLSLDDLIEEGLVETYEHFRGLEPDEAAEFGNPELEVDEDGANYIYRGTHWSVFMGTKSKGEWCDLELRAEAREADNRWGIKVKLHMLYVG